jgi:hypothetical protein
MQYAPGTTVQCLNPVCVSRGRWVRVESAPQEVCSHCGLPLQIVPPPLMPRFRMRMRARPLIGYRPVGRPR